MIDKKIKRQFYFQNFGFSVPGEIITFFQLKKCPSTFDFVYQRFAQEVQILTRASEYKT